MISGKSRGGVPACCVYVRCISAQLGPDAPTRARLHTATPAAGEPMARAYAFIGSNTCARAPRCLAVPLSAPFRHWEGSAVRQQATPSPGSEAIVRITVLFFPPVYWRSTKICISTLIKSARDTVQNESVAQNVHFPDSYHRFMIENVGTILI